MSKIHFEPYMDNLCIFKVDYHNQVSQKYKGMIFGDTSSHYYAGGLVREKNDWAIYINQYIALPLDEIDLIVKKMNSEYSAKGYNENVTLEGKFIVRRLSSELNDFLDSLIRTPGVIVYSIVMLGENDTLFAFKYSNTEAEAVTKLLTEPMSHQSLGFEVLYINDERLGKLPGFFKFASYVSLNFSDFVLVSTKWEISPDNIKNQNEGIFQNEMYFKPKFFGESLSPIYGQLVTAVKGEEIKGNSKFRLVGKRDEGKNVEFDVRSYWFNDFYNKVIRNINGAFTYWGYCDGKGEVDNYYVIYENVLRDFLLGIKMLWGAEARMNHYNYITTVSNLDSVATSELSASIQI
ncbi:MAG: hypothetical protein M1526_06385 [Candidatus Thermoplasmatota archaeon]|jgi:hypothetical protein|nr:hypothetical protein [Candidatus Thermoplasmatota archaeon]